MSIKMNEEKSTWVEDINSGTHKVTYTGSGKNGGIVIPPLPEGTYTFIVINPSSEEGE